MVSYLAFSPCLCRSLVISRYGLFCCFRSLACLIASLELPLTVSSSRVIFGPLTHTMSGWEDVDDRLGRIVAEGALGHACCQGQHKSGCSEWPSQATWPGSVGRSRTSTCIFPVPGLLDTWIECVQLWSVVSDRACSGMRPGSCISASSLTLEGCQIRLWAKRTAGLLANHPRFFSRNGSQPQARWCSETCSDLILLVSRRYSYSPKIQACNFVEHSQQCYGASTRSKGVCHPSSDVRIQIIAMVIGCLSD